MTTLPSNVTTNLSSSITVSYVKVTNFATSVPTMTLNVAAFIPVIHWNVGVSQVYTTSGLVETVGVNEGVTLGVALNDGVFVGVDVGVKLGVLVGVLLGVLVTEGVTLANGVTLGVLVGVILGVTVGVVVIDGVTLGVTLGVILGLGVIQISAYIVLTQSSNKQASLNVNGSQPILSGISTSSSSM